MVSDKKLVQEVTGWLKVFDDGSVDRTWTGPPEARFMTEPVPPHHEFKNGVATSDVIIDPTSGLTVRIYLPEKKPGDEDKLPVLLHFHGGGFCVSQADWYIYYHTYTVLAIRARVICVSVYLRRAPENRLPAACEDGYSALLWLQCVAKGQSEQPWLHSHADFTRVFLIGDSSGGNLVHQVAAVWGKMQLSPLRLAGGVMIHPGFVRSERSKSELQQEDSPFLTLEMVDKFLKLALPVGSNKEHPITCPMGAAAPPISDLKLPPLLLCVAEKDQLMDTEMEYYEAMKKGGKDVELLINMGVGHSFYLDKIALLTDPHTAAQADHLIAGITDFIKNH